MNFISGVNLKFNAFKKLSKKQRVAFKQKSERKSFSKSKLKITK